MQGQIYYQINTSLYAETNDVPSNGQLFIIDKEQALKYRMNQDFDENIMKNLDTIMRNNNSHAQSHEMMNDELMSRKKTMQRIGHRKHK